MRAVAAWVAGLVGLVVLAAAAIWLALPWLLSPPTPPRLPPGAGTAAVSPAALLAAARPGPGGTEALTLTAAQADALLALLMRAPGPAAAGISAAQVSFAAGAIDLRVWGSAPADLPIARLDGRPFELQARVSAHLPAPGVVDLSLTDLRLGHLPVTGIFPPAAVMGALASLLHTPPTWLRLQGATLRLDLTKAPPIAAAPLQLHLVPTALAVSPGALAVSVLPSAQVSLDPATLSRTLAEALLAQGGGALPTLQFYPGSAEVTLVSGSGASLSVEHIELTVGVPEPGVLHIGVTGVTPEGAAAILVQALGRVPPWLAVDAQGLDVDFGSIAPISVATGVSLRLLPTSAALGPGGLLASVRIVPVAGG